METMKLPVK